MIARVSELEEALAHTDKGFDSRIGVYDENGKLYEIVSVDDQGAGSPVAIIIRSV